MMRYVPLALVTLLACSAALATPPGTSRAQREQRRFEDTLNTLNKAVKNVQFEERPLEETLGWFRDNGLGNIAIYWSEIEKQSGIHRKTPITLALTDASLGEVLDWVLALASQQAGGPHQELTYHIDRGVVVIATAEYFNNKVVIRIYDIVAAVQPVPYYDEHGAQISGRHKALLRRTASVDAAGGRGTQTLPSGTSSHGSLLDIKEAHVVELIDVLYQMKPDTWERNGGQGWLRRFKDRLIIAQTIEMHEMIGGTFKPGRLATDN